MRRRESCESEKADQGEVALKDASKAVMKMLRDVGVNEQEIDASEVRKRRISEKPFNVEERQVYYAFSQEFVVKISDLKIYPTLAEKLNSFLPGQTFFSVPWNLIAPS